MTLPDGSAVRRNRAAPRGADALLDTKDITSISQGER
jgi:hypothetical protein